MISNGSTCELEFQFTSELGANISSLEHVLVSLSLSIVPTANDSLWNLTDYYKAEKDGEAGDWLQSPHPRRGDVEIELTSPAGTRSTLLPHRDYDFVNTEGYDNWPFMSVHFWGEDPTGTWTLRTTFRASSGHIAVKDASVTMLGVAEVPISASTLPPSCHPTCVRGCHAEGRENCDACKDFRLVSTLECVDDCPNGTHPFNKYCVIDSEDDVNGIQCPTDEVESYIDAKSVGLGVVAVVVLVGLVLTVVVGLVLLWRRKNKTRFRRLFNDTTAVGS